MGLQDLVITPIYVVLFSLLAYMIRPYVTNRKTRKYFLPALWVRFVGAIALGLIYQFYYDKGDTYSYFNQASIIYDALINDPVVGLKLLQAKGNMTSDTFAYASKIYWFKAPSEYFIIKLTAIASFFGLGTYSSASLFFASFSFSGSWMMFMVIQKKYPRITKWIAISMLFVPSCIFWGSGILKDTITLGALGFLFWGSYQIIEKRKYNFLTLLVVLSSSWIIYSVKIYILLCFIPAGFIWWYKININSIKNSMVRLSVIPIFMAVFLGGGYLLLERIASTSDRYNLDSLAEWSYITSYDIRYFSGKEAGSGYDIGAQDGTWQTLIKLSPAAINVSLFRPYLWEVRNPLMLLSAIESSIMLFLTIAVLPKILNGQPKKGIFEPMTLMMLTFSLAFAFAVGVSTYNFGSLSRYKIPMIPYFTSVLVLANHFGSKSRIGKYARMI